MNTRVYGTINNALNLINSPHRGFKSILNSRNRLKDRQAVSPITSNLRTNKHL